MISSFMLSHLVLPTLVSVCGHISFCFLLLSKAWRRKAFLVLVALRFTRL